LDKILVRQMVRDDASAVAQLIKRSFADQLHPYIVYCQTGAATYLSLLAVWPQAFPNHRLLAAESVDGRLVGFAEFRAADPTSCVLSYICVADTARGSGLAEKLILAHLDAHPELESIELDVFSHNVAAVRLYKRLGFTRFGSKQWWSRDLPDATQEGSGRLVVSDWHVSHASLEQYGFAMISGLYEGDPIELGLTSPTVIRTATLGWFMNDDLLAQVRSLLPHIRQVMMIGHAAAAPPAPSELILESHRLRGASATVKAARR
jgi:ribosomal protein S18 acetylase RimI-like enzyme